MIAVLLADSAHGIRQAVSKLSFWQQKVNSGQPDDSYSVLVYGLPIQSARAPTWVVIAAKVAKTVVALGRGSFSSNTARSPTRATAPIWSKSLSPIAGPDLVKWAPFAGNTGRGPHDSRPPHPLLLVIRLVAQ